ncbi:RNA polymerase sigma factor [Alcanivorax sp.]|uniref:RNA polymerase sigma factor n=1 Tax=Alcanivorax sp. TaxID=1872427 RepID=UPI00261F4166|nr:RNA polymerase sigma factor [Alcanivorax sp.]
MDGTAFTREVDALFARESRRVLATLIRLLGDFDLAEDALQEAFMAALRQWPEEGIPDNARAWLVSTGRFKAIDQLRRRARYDQILHQQAEQLTARSVVEMEVENVGIEDDRLRLIFTCCHPGLAQEAQVALTLREVCGLTTEEIARAFLKKPSTVAQRIVRAKAKIRDARIPYEVPEGDDLFERLQSVLQVIYLVFNEGYLASSGEQLLRHDLSEEAIRLAELVLALLPRPEPEAQGLLALMLLHHARRATRTTTEGELVLLEQQDRSLWDREEIARADELVRSALLTQRFGPYTLQAAIAAVHALAPSSDATDWAEIVGLYDLLLTMMPSPIVALNRAVAVAMRDGPQAGLQALEPLMEDATLRDYHLAHAARADMHRRLGQREPARSAYQAALDRATQPAEQRFLRQRLAELG